ncbi:polysaccharide pyruvyl transferase family protein [Horticoccus sp. 23ND18S-11]|uniref:polysaccharide pyruvyl transferase family protein n=1 Tax=Horticoccus sp. 23ND18S-11 TaxID=3391832 RepID=UPI0039C9F426
MLPWLPAASRAADATRPPRILLRPGTGQKGNIGDIAHTPGALQVFERYFPAAEFTVWPVLISPEAREHLVQRFPRLRIVEGELDAHGRPTTPALRAAWNEADLLLHGSSPGFKGGPYLPAWRAASRKPYGIFGLTSDPVSNLVTRPDGGTLQELERVIAGLPVGHLRGPTLELLSGAAFVFCRETLTADYFRRQGVRSPVLEFGPDATFGLHLRDEPRAIAYLRAQGLEEGRFIAVIPRLRYTPYHSINGQPIAPADRAKDEINARTVAGDHAKLRDLIVAWVRGTGLKVLACPEMSYQIPLAKKELIDPLPADVKAQVVWRDTYWLPDEAASIYARATAVISFECHSPIIALTNGTPAFYVRQPTDTIKGRMYHDIGVSDWTCEVDETSGRDLWARLQAIHADPAQARARVRRVMAGVEARLERMVGVARAAIAAG